MAVNKPFYVKNGLNVNDNLSISSDGMVDTKTGTNIASAATINLNTATGNRVHITGTTTITAVTLTRGPRTLIFDGILTLTHHATNNNLPGAANITTAAGDRAIYESDGTTVYCVAYIPVIGQASLGANFFTGTQTFKGVTDTVFTITDAAAFEIDPANGSVQVVTLGASRTPAATNFAAGQTVILGINDGTAYAVTWTTVNPTWVKAGGTGAAPTLATTGFTWVLLWKVGSTMYAAEVGKP